MAAGVYLDEGVPAVVAMQGDIAGDDDARLACELYRALLVRTAPAIDTAVARRTRTRSTRPASASATSPSRR